jgi:hypothetical protein
MEFEYYYYAGHTIWWEGPAISGQTPIYRAEEVAC